MQINQSELFVQQFEEILFTIASDKVSAALHFQKEVITNFATLKEFPYKSRQSQYYDDIAIRDLTVKGYTIIYKINEEKERIEVLEIFNRNLPVKRNGA
jgi:plasmid stabilization system protein ParE